MGVRGNYRYSTEELLKDLRRVQRQVGRGAFSFPIYQEEGHYAATTVLLRFGTFRGACAAAGIRLRRLHPYWRSQRRKAQELRVTLDCLKCENPFSSWNRKKNRLCPSCTMSNAGLDEEQLYACAL
jgi:hypothetical protein